jgi:hypothetical protein
VYSIPLDSARQDAAPHHLVTATGGGGSGSGGQSGGTGGGGSAGGGSAGGGSAGSGQTGSAGRAAGSASDAGTGVAGTVPVLIPGGQPGSLVHSSNGFGSSSSVPGLNAPASGGLGAVQSDASSAPLLAILLALVVIAIGVYAGTRARRPAGGESAQSSS